MQLERTRIWKFLSYKIRNERNGKNGIGKNYVGKFEPKLDKFLFINTALKTFQLKWKILTSNFPNSRFFPTALSIYMYPDRSIESSANTQIETKNFFKGSCRKNIAL